MQFITTFVTLFVTKFNLVTNSSQKTLGLLVQQILCKSFEVDADLVSGTNIAVKSAPMMQSAAYNQNVPENFSGDSTCVGDYKGY